MCLVVCLGGSAPWLETVKLSSSNSQRYRILSSVNTTVLSHRAEKDKAQFAAELNDLRAGVDHLSNEKVFYTSVFDVDNALVLSADLKSVSLQKL